MSSLQRRLAELYTAGHARDDIELHVDTRAEDGLLRSAAVLAAITERARPGILLIHRPSNMRAHPGQVAFPGGKIDEGETAVDAALREAEEELGLPRDAVGVIGESDRYATGSGFDITPVIGVIPPDLELRPNPAEVAQWFEAPLDFVFDPANQKPMAFEYGGMIHSTWEIVWQGHRIWGVTAGIVVNLSRRMRQHG